MKFILATLCALAPLVSYAGPVTASTGDVTVTVCAKNASVLLVVLRGESAFRIYSTTAKRLNTPIEDLGGTLTNNMNCIPTAFSQSAVPTAAKCSFVMIDGKNVAYPQIDPFYSGEEIIECQ